MYSSTQILFQFSPLFSFFLSFYVSFFSFFHFFVSENVRPPACTTFSGIKGGGHVPLCPPFAMGLLRPNSDESLRHVIDSCVILGST